MMTSNFLTTTSTNSFQFVLQFVLHYRDKPAVKNGGLDFLGEIRYNKATKRKLKTVFGLYTDSLYIPQSGMHCGIDFKAYQKTKGGHYEG